MHPEFALELNRQYQAEARAEAAHRRLARRILRRRKQEAHEAACESEPTRSEGPSPPPPQDFARPSAELPRSRDKAPLPTG